VRDVHDLMRTSSMQSRMAMLQIRTQENNAVLFCAEDRRNDHVGVRY